MKKILALSILLVVALSLLYAQTPSRTVYQKLILDPASSQDMLNYVTNTGNTHSPHYILRALHIETGVERGTETYPATVMKIAKLGTAPNQYVAAAFNQSIWPTPWPEGSHLKIRIWCTDATTNPSGVEPYPQYEYAEKTFVVPSGGGAILMTAAGQEMIVPPFPVIPTTHIISGMITSQWDLSGVEISATDIVPTDITYDAGAYTVTVPDGWDGTVTPYKEGYIFEPASYTYTDVIADTPNQDFVMKTVVVPGVPTNLSPNATTLTYTEPTAVVLTWDAVAIAEGYKLQWNEGEIQDLGNVLTWTTPALDAGTYTWKVCAYNNTATKSYTPVRVQINSRSTSPANSPKADGGWAEASFIVEIETIPENYTVEITSVPAGAAIYVGGVDSGQITPYTFTLAEGSDAVYTVVMGTYTWTPAQFVVEDISENMSCNFVLTFPADVPITPPGVPAGFDITIQLTGGSALYTTGIPTSAVNPSWNMGYVQFMTLLGLGPWQLTINTTYSFVWIVGVGVYTGPFPMDITIPGGTKDQGAEIQYGSGGDPTLPVELSYFAATLTAENFVNIAWTTQTETNMNGFNIYRNEGSENLAGAIQIAYIPATNTSTTQNYKHIDREVENGHTYYYWLECVEMNNHSTFNGPSPVYVDGPTPPVLPEYTTMQNAYPNPFRAGDGTTIKVDVKAGDTGTVTIYNILGQVVKTFPVTQGTNNLTWNARDSKGNLCGNGIYFYKLSTNSLNQTKKMVIVK